MKVFFSECTSGVARRPSELTGPNSACSVVDSMENMKCVPVSPLFASKGVETPMEDEVRLLEEI